MNDDVEKKKRVERNRKHPSTGESDTHLLTENKSGLLWLRLTHNSNSFVLSDSTLRKNPHYKLEA
jgi:hypothetical protein